jgi:hypothetical protein
MSIKLSTYYKGCDIPDFPEENLFHSKELFLIYEETPGYTPYLFAAFRGDKLLAHLLAVVQKDRRFFSHSFIRRCEVYDCGEYTASANDKEGVFGLLLEHLTEEVLQSSFMIEFRNLSDLRFGYKCFRENNYFPINWLKVHNSLHGNKTVEQRLSVSRLRQIKKALKNGAVVDEARSEEEVKEFSLMLQHAYSSHFRKYFPDIAFFNHLYNKWENSGKAKIFVVKYKYKIIGGSVCIYSEDNAYLWFSGGMRKTYALQYPGVLAVWKALKDAQNNGYRHFEFMDVGLPFKQYGFREFVLRFGGKQSSTRRWFRFRWKWMNNLCMKLYY